MRFAGIIILVGAGLLASCTHQRSTTLRIDHIYDIPCEPYNAKVRVGDDGFISFTYTVSPTETLEVQCKGRTTFIGQVIPTPIGRAHHVTAYDGTEWKTTSLVFTNQANIEMNPEQSGPAYPPQSVGSADP